MLTRAPAVHALAEDARHDGTPAAEAHQGAALVIEVPSGRMTVTKTDRQRGAWRKRSRRSIGRKNAGDIVLPTGTVLDEDLLDGLAGLGCFIGRDRTKPGEVAEAVLDYLRDAVSGRRM